MVSYLDEKAMMWRRSYRTGSSMIMTPSSGYRFDPASRVSASRSRFHGRTRRHQEDADTYADSIMELCRLAIHRAHRSFVRNSSVNNLFGVSLTLN